MVTIDLHTHLFPQCAFKALDEGRGFYGLHPGRDENGQPYVLWWGRRQAVMEPERRARYTPEGRIKEMDAGGVGVQVVSGHTGMFNYNLPPEQGLQFSRDVNDEIAGMVRGWPKRFMGLGNVPMQDVKLAVGELERVLAQGLRGAMLDTEVAGLQWDEPAFEPFFTAAEDRGAILLYHVSSARMMADWPQRYQLSNTIGNPLDDTRAGAALIFGGILERHPNLKVILSHGGGNLCFGIARMERGYDLSAAARANISQRPSAYLRRMYYDIITWGEAQLRFLIDQVGADRVVLGSDYPHPYGPDNSVQWLNAMASITKEERELILGKNAERLLGIG